MRLGGGADFTASVSPIPFRPLTCFSPLLTSLCLATAAMRVSHSGDRSKDFHLYLLIMVHLPLQLLSVAAKNPEDDIEEVAITILEVFAIVAIILGIILKLYRLITAFQVSDQFPSPTPPNEELNPHVPFINRKRLDAFPTHRFPTKAGVLLYNETECPICKVEYNKWDTLRSLGNCGHAFHKECIDNHLLRFSTTCPICRLDCQQDPPIQSV